MSTITLVFEADVSREASEYVDGTSFGEHLDRVREDNPPGGLEIEFGSGDVIRGTLKSIEVE